MHMLSLQLALQNIPKSHCGLSECLITRVAPQPARGLTKYIVWTPYCIFFILTLRHSFNSLFFLLYFSIIIYPSLLSPTSTHPLPPNNHHIVVLVHESFLLFGQSFHPQPPPSPPPELSACSVSRSLSLFCCILLQFSLFIKFHMSEIIQYNICFSLTGLFHLA